jgi:hypothetical protein
MSALRGRHVGTRGGLSSGLARHRWEIREIGGYKMQELVITYPLITYRFVEVVEGGRR